MRRILLDENTPQGVRAQLSGHDVHTTLEMGWSGLTNGRLLDAAEAAGFEVMITGDKNLVSQQRLSGRRLTVLEISTTHWPTIREHPRLIDDAIAGAGEGDYVVVKFPRPPLRRRPPPTPP
jgi:hypothetical protein